MRRLLSLIRVVVKQGFDDVLNMSNIQKKKQTKKTRTLQLIVMVGLLLYFAAFIFFPAYYITEGFLKMGQPTLVISLLFTIGPVVSLYFAILSTPGIFYFSNDTQDLLTLPLQPWEIVFARFASAYLQTLMGSSLIYIPVLLSYFIVVNPGFLFIITALIAFLIVPIIPLALAYLVTVLTMTFIPFVKNKDLYMYFSFAMIIVPTFFLSFMLSGISEDTDIIQMIVMALVSGDNTAYQYLDIFLPTSKMLVHWMIDYSIFDLLLALLFSGGILGAVTFLTQKLYFNGLLSVKESSSKKRRLRKNEEAKHIKLSSLSHALLRYDLKRILRTPSFALNYFSPMVMIPIFALFPLLANGIPSLTEINAYTQVISTTFNQGLAEIETLKQIAITLSIGVGFGMFMGNLDVSSNTAISREGYMMKEFLTMPLHFSDIVYAKAKFSIIANSIVPTIITLVLIVLLSPPILLIVLFILSVAVGVVFITYTSILFDVLYPNLNWVTEQQASKGNFKTAIVILPFMFIPVLLVVVSFYMNAFFSITILGVALPVLTYYIYKIVGVQANTRLVDRVQNL